MYLLYDLYLIAGKQLSLEPRGTRDVPRPSPLVTREGKTKQRTTFHTCSMLLCFLMYASWNFYSNSMIVWGKNCIFNRWKIKFGKFESLVSLQFHSEGLRWKMNERKKRGRFIYLLWETARRHLRHLLSSNAVGTGVRSKAEVTRASQLPHTCERAIKQTEDWFMIDWWWEH